MRGCRGGMVQRTGFLQRMVPVILLAVILSPTAQSHLRQLPGTRRAPCMKSISLRLRGGSGKRIPKDDDMDPEREDSMDSEDFVNNMLERRAYHVDVSEFKYDEDESIAEDDLFENPVAIADQETKDRVVGQFMAKTGLNFPVARTVIAGFNWDLERAVDVHFGRADPTPRKGEANYDDAEGTRLYSPREMIDYDNLDEIATIEKDDDTVGYALMPPPPPPHTLRSFHDSPRSTHAPLAGFAWRAYAYSMVLGGCRPIPQAYACLMVLGRWTF